MFVKKNVQIKKIKRLKAKTNEKTQPPITFENNHGFVDVYKKNTLVHPITSVFYIKKIKINLICTKGQKS